MKDLGLIRKIFLVLFSIAVLCCTTVVSTAWSAALSPQKTDGSPVKSLSVGESKFIELKQRVTKVEVVDPTVAGVMVLSPWKLYLTGKTPGSTRLIMKSGDNLISSIIAVEVSPNVALLKTKLHEMFPEEKDIRVTAAIDNITLSGTVSSTAVLSQVLALAQSYAPVDKENKNNDNKPKVLNFLEVQGVHQVMLEVRVSEMSRSLMKRLGVNFNYISQNGANLGISLLGALTSLPQQGWPGNPLTVSNTVNYITRFTRNGETWTAFIDAMKEDGLVKVLAEPTLITMSGKTANFIAGGEYPIPVPQTSGGGTTITIDYKTYGVGLKFTPTVLSNGKINMQVAPEVSELDVSNAVTVSGYVVPALTTRRVATTIELGDGQSFAIAGLLREELREDVKKFPILGDIPILGTLFRSTYYQKNESELVIIVTPHLVKPLDMAKQTLPTDAFIEPNDFEFYLLGSTEGRGKKQTGSSLAPPPEGGMEGDFGYITP
jgi:pilus assembly protein CpaC